MQQLWQDPNFRMLLIIILASFSILFFLFIIIFIMLIGNIRAKKQRSKQKTQKLKGFIKRLGEMDMPAEISGILEELQAELVMLEESTGEHIKTFFALVQGIEEKVKLLQVSYNLMEQKMVATLATIVGRLKKTNKEQVDRHAKGFFQKLNRLENEEFKRLEERLIEVETYIEAVRMIKSFQEKDNSDKKSE